MCARDLSYLYELKKVTGIFKPKMFSVFKAMFADGVQPTSSAAKRRIQLTFMQYGI